MYIVKAVWTNGSGGLSSSEYSEDLGEFSDLETAKKNSEKLFKQWREKNPENDGWKSSAWIKISPKNLIIAYIIESGWENSPLWYCPVVKGEKEFINHLETTQRLGDAPSILIDLETCGLYFSCRGSLWPLEAREGRLAVAESNIPQDELSTKEKSRLNWKDISFEDVMMLL